MIDRSPNNTVIFSQGMGTLTKRYNIVGGVDGKMSGWAFVRFSDSGHYSILIPESLVGWASVNSMAPNGFDLNWFREDIRKAAEVDPRIREFVVARPKMGIRV